MPYTGWILLTFSMFEADLETLQDRSVVGRHLSCVLHRTLPRAPELRYLKVISGSSMTRSRPQRVSVKRIQTKLKTVLILPPAVYAIDISAPRCQSLEFEMPTETGLSQYEERPLVSRFPLIPTIENSPVDIVNLARVTCLCFALCSTDTMSRLEQWLLQVPNLTKHPIRGNSAWVSHRPPVDPQPPEIRVDEGILQALIEHPEWLPNLTHLQLEYCLVRDQKLIEFVKMRKESKTTKSLTKSSILKANYSGPSEKTHIWLHREISSEPWPEFGPESRLSESKCRAWGRIRQCDSEAGKYE